ncbi:hypothetical protein P8605_29310 [Streptomyces sp. T-3]|nr:hypothetical protein [Streptomyces sp. T-3]
MTRAKKILVACAVVAAAVCGGTTPAFADNHLPVSPLDNHLPVSPLDNHLPVSPSEQLAD